MHKIQLLYNYDLFLKIYFILIMIFLIIIFFKKERNE